MRLGFAAVLTAMLCAWLAPAEAAAQVEIRLSANPVPVIDVRVDQRPARLEVVPELAGGIVLNPGAAERLGVRLVPFPRGTLRLTDGDAAVRTRLGMQRVYFGDLRGPRVMVAPHQITDAADGVIGIAALPHSIVTFVMREESADAVDITLPLTSQDAIFPRVEIGGIESWISIDFRRGPTLFNRLVGRQLDAAGRFTPAGAPVETPVLLGLSAMMQPVHANFAVAGLPVSSAVVRTDAGLIGAAHPDDLVVEAGALTRRYPRIILGRDALARCSAVRIDRPAQMFTLRCARPADAAGEASGAS